MSNLLILFVSAFLISCEEENLAVSESEINSNKKLPVVCNLQDPVNNLAWLQNKIKEFKESTYLENRMNIWVSRYKGQELIIIYTASDGSNGIVSDGIAQYYTCTGQLYCDYTNKPCPNFYKEIKLQVKYHTVIQK